MSGHAPTRLPAGRLLALATAALDRTADAVLVLGVTGGVLYANRTAGVELQLPAGELLDRPIFEFLPSLTPVLWAARWAEFRAGGTLRFVDRMRRADGSLFPVDVQASLVVADGDEYALLVARDLSECRRVEVALRESGEAFRALAEHGPMVVARYGRDRRVLYVNQPVATFLGQPAEAIVGQSVRELLPRDPEAAATVEAGVERVLREGVEVWAMIAAGGREFEWRAVPELTEKGDVASVLGIATDVTEHHALVRELRTSHDLLAAVVDSAEEGIIVVDRELRYLVRNRFVEELTGIPSTDLLGVAIVERDLPQLGELIVDLERALAGETFRSRDGEVLVRPGYAPAWVQVTYSPMRDASGAVTGVTMILHDVTARREAERERRELEARTLEAQKLESLGLLASGIAHDFNNLLVGILGNASLGLAHGSVDDETRERLRDIELAARRAAELTRQMVDYAGAGRAPVQPLDLSELMRETADLMRVAIPRTVQLELELGRGLPPVVAERSQLQQVAMNLLINAGEAVAGSGPGAGTVRVRTLAEHVTPELAAEAGAAGGGEIGAGLYAILEVEDDGSGMDEATAARVFEPFFSTKGQGRGLGMSSVLGVVRGHRGALRLVSEQGRGTTVRVLLPASLGAVAAGAAPAARVAEQAELRSEPATAPEGGPPQPAVPVLLVEDEEHVARIVTRTLQLAGYEVAVATDGLEALAFLERRRAGVRAVVLDLAMPNLDGAAAYRRLRELDPELPVLITSGYSGGQPGVPAPDDRHAAFLAKPYVPAELVAALGRLVAGGEEGP